MYSAAQKRAYAIKMSNNRQRTASRSRAAPRRARATPAKKFTAYGEASIPGFGSAGFNYTNEKRLRKPKQYIAPVSGISSVMSTSANPIMTASARGAVCITQREILTTITPRIDAPGSNFNLEIFDVNPGLSTICSWGSQLAKAFQEYKLKFRLVYTASCPSITPGQILIAFDSNVGNPTIPTDKQQMSNFSGCVSGQVWASMESNWVSSPGKLFIRDGPIPSGQSPQLYDFTKILLATADQDASLFTSSTYGTLYIEYAMELFLPKLQFADESILFSQLETNDYNLSQAQLRALDYHTPVSALFDIAGPVNDTDFTKRLVPHVKGNLEIMALMDDLGVFNIVFPTPGYYSITLGCYSTPDAGTSCPFVAWPDVSEWETGTSIGGIWSISNPSVNPAGQGGLVEQEGSLPDGVIYTQQTFLVWATGVGTYVDNQYNVNGGSWIACQMTDSYTNGATRGDDNRIYSSFILIAPVGEEAISYFDPSFAPLPSMSVSGKEHMARRSVKRFSQRHYKSRASKAASSVPVEDEGEEIKEEKKESKQEKLRGLQLEMQRLIQSMQQ